MKTLYFVFVLLFFCLIFCESKENSARQYKFRQTIKKDVFEDLELNVIEVKQRKLPFTDEFLKDFAQSKYYHNFQQKNARASSPSLQNDLFYETFCNTSTGFSLCPGNAPLILKGSNKLSYNSQVVYNSKKNEFFAVYIYQQSQITSIYGVRFTSSGTLISISEVFPGLTYVGRKQSPKLLVDTINELYLLAFEFIEVDATHSGAITAQFISFEGIPINFFVLDAPLSSSFDGMSVAFDISRNQYLISVGRRTQIGTSVQDIIVIFFCDPIKMAIKGNSFSFTSGYSDSFPSVSINGDGSLYFVVFQMGLTNELSSISINASSLNVTNTHYLSWDVETPFGTYQTSAFNPQVFFVPSINQFLLVAELNVTALGFSEIAYTLFSNDTSYNGTIYPLTPTNDGLYYSTTSIALIQGSLAAAVFQETSPTQTVIGFLTFDMATQQVSAQTTLSSQTANSYLPTVAYNNDNQTMVLLWESNVANTPPVQPITSGSSNNGVGAAVGIAIAVVIVISVAIGFIFYCLKKKNKRRRETRLNEEELE